MSVRAQVNQLLPLAVLLFAVVSVPLRILSEDGLPRYRKLSDELTEISAQNQALKQRIRDKTRRVKALKTDPRAVERVARDELGMIREGEIVFQFAPSSATFLTESRGVR